MGGGAFLGGLAGGAASVLLMKKQMDFSKEQQENRELTALFRDAVSSGQQGAAELIGQMLNERLAGGKQGKGGKGGKKGTAGADLNSIMAKFRSMIGAGGGTAASPSSSSSSPSSSDLSSLTKREAPASTEATDYGLMPSRPAALQPSATMSPIPTERRPASLTGFAAVGGAVQTPEQKEAALLKMQEESATRTYQKETDIRSKADIAEADATYRQKLEHINNLVRDGSITPDQAAEARAALVGVKSTGAFKLAYGAAIPGDQLPPDAVDLKGAPIPESMRTKETSWKMYQYGSSFRYEPAQTSAKKSSTKEQIQSEISEAFKNRDMARVNQLQAELKAIDPLAAERIQISLTGQSERHNEMEIKRATSFDDKYTQPWLDQLGRVNAIKNALADPEGWKVLGPADNTLMFSLIEQTRPVKGFRLNDAELRREFGGTGWQDKATRMIRSVTSGAQIGDRQRGIVIRLLNELLERRRVDILRSSQVVRKVPDDLIDPQLKVPVAGGFAKGISVVAPNGKTYTFPDQAAADAFKASAGIK